MTVSDYHPLKWTKASMNTHFRGLKEDWCQAHLQWHGGANLGRHH